MQSWTLKHVIPVFSLSLLVSQSCLPVHWPHSLLNKWTFSTKLGKRLAPSRSLPTSVYNSREDSDWPGLGIMSSSALVIGPAGWASLSAPSRAQWAQWWESGGWVKLADSCRATWGWGKRSTKERGLPEGEGCYLSRADREWKNALP